MAKRKVVVVDGSNLATEGRSTPSLAQLDESVKAFVKENPGVEVIVVVDATFEHRVAKEERDRFKEAELAGEVVTPPAGAIGRGDAFILKIAARADAVVLSNDSFQEFHAEHPWLFDDGRLIGGKPVAGVGWIFTARNPVRGPKSRAVRSKAAAQQRADGASGDDEAGTAHKAPARGRVRGSAAAATAATAAAAAPKAPAKQAARSKPAAADAAPKKRAAKAAAPARAAKVQAQRAAPEKRGTSSAATKAADVQESPAKRRAAPARRTDAAAGAPPKKVAKPSRGDAPADRPASRHKSPAQQPRGTDRPDTTKANGKPSTTGRPKRADDGPANTQKAFSALVANHPLRSSVEGEVTTFTSHGAMVTIAVGRGMHVVCYAPLARLGKPAPTRVRDVLKKGERRSFRIAAFDEERRIAELSLL